jgi:hypothetical protein
MKWFNRWFTRKVLAAWENRHCVDTNSAKEILTSNTSISGRSSVRFTIYPASGGFVVEHQLYERHHDSDGPKLTIINQGEDLGDALAHIITMESLSR